jgi:hypothetical protein
MGIETNPRIAQKGDKEFKPLPHNWPAVMTTITATLSKEKTHLYQLHVPYLECLKKKKARELC